MESMYIHVWNTCIHNHGMHVYAIPPSTSLPRRFLLSFWCHYHLIMILGSHSHTIFCLNCNIILIMYIDQFLGLQGKISRTNLLPILANFCELGSSSTTISSWVEGPQSCTHNVYKICVLILECSSRNQFVIFVGYIMP